MGNYRKQTGSEYTGCLTTFDLSGWNTTSLITDLGQDLKKNINAFSNLNELCGVKAV